MRVLWVAVAAAALVGAQLAGAYTLGFVASGSMEPTLPKGSLFLAFAGEAQVGDIVVFEAQGTRIVHRVVDVREGRLVTQGDANLDDDVALVGMIDPAEVQVVPALGGQPLAIHASLLRPSLLAGLQVGMLAIGVSGLLAARSQEARPGLLRHLRPHHVVAFAALALLATAPLHIDAAEANGLLGVRASVVPIVAHVTAGHEESVLHIAPLQEATMDASGDVAVRSAPDLPGAGVLLHYGTVVGILPAVALLSAFAIGLRYCGW